MFWHMPTKLKVLSMTCIKRIILFLGFYAAFSIVADEFYSTTIQIPDQTVSSQDYAIDNAFKEVLIAITGMSTAEEVIRSKKSFVDKRQFIEALSFVDMESDVIGDENLLGLRVTFSKLALNQFALDSGLRVLSSVKPKFLFWILIDKEETGREFLGNDSEHPFSDQIREKLISRNVSYFYPIYDLQDQLALPVDDAWNLKTNSVTSASSRYESDGWVLVRFYETTSGEIRGTWSCSLNGEIIVEDFLYPSIADFFDEKFNDLLDRILFPFTFSPLKQTLHLDLAFNNVNEYLDYKTLVSNLENLEIIQSMKLSSISPNQIIFEVETSADIKFLSRAINGFEFLTQENEVKSDQANLNFNWVD